MKRVLWLLVLFILAACAPSKPIPTTIPTATVTPEITLSLEVRPTLPCGYQWASQPLPEISEQFQQAVDSAGITDLTIRAEAFGENCVNPDGSIQKFLLLQTDLYIAAVVPDLTPPTLGDQIERVFAAIQQIPTDELPGPGSSAGYITFEFSANGEMINLRLQRQQVLKALAEGIHGEALYQMLAP